MIVSKCFCSLHSLSYDATWYTTLQGTTLYCCIEKTHNARKRVYYLFPWSYDSIFFSKNGNSVSYAETNPHVSQKRTGHMITDVFSSLIHGKTCFLKLFGTLIAVSRATPYHSLQTSKQSKEKRCFLYKIPASLLHDLRLENRRSMCLQIATGTQRASCKVIKMLSYYILRQRHNNYFHDHVTPSF